MAPGSLDTDDSDTEEETDALDDEIAKDSDDDDFFTSSSGGSDSESLAVSSRDIRQQETLERRWRKLSGKGTVLFGSKLLVFVNISQHLYWFLALILRSTDSSCNIYPFFTFEDQRMHFVIAVFFLTTLGFAYCIRNPRISVYIPTLGLWYAVVFFTFPLLPMEDWSFRFHCTRLGLDDRAAASKLTIPYELLQVNMCVILLTPMLVPQQWLVRVFVWSWSFAYWLWAVCLVPTSPEGHDDLKRAVWDHVGNADALLALAYLGIISLYADLGVKQRLDGELRKQFMLDEDKKQLTANLFRMLEYMVPSFLVTKILREPGCVHAECVDKASILFIEVDGFDSIAARMSPGDLLSFLNQYFQRFDDICAQRKVTKIETWCAEYVCAVGVVPQDIATQESFGHEDILARLIKVALDILDLQHCEQEEPVAFRMGMHTGPVVAGVVGQKLARFRLFGDTINTAARMMQKGLPGELQFGDATKECLPASARTTSRGRIEMKGKGLVQAHLLWHSKTGLHQEVAQRVETHLDSVCASPTRRPERTRTMQMGLLTRAMSLGSGIGSPVRHRQSIASSGLLSQAAVTVQRTRSMGSQWTRKFEQVMKDLSDNEDPTTWCQRCFCFEASGEQDFQQRFHKEYMCRDLVRRANFWLLAIAFLTCAELAYLLLTQTVWTGSAPGAHRGNQGGVVLFLAFRAAAVGVVGMWRFAAEYYQQHLEEWVFSMQFALLVSCWVVAVSSFMSYISLQWVTPEEHERHDIVRGLRNNVVALAFFPMYIFVTEAIPFRFKLACSFPVLAALLIVVVPNDRNEVFQAAVFKIIFILRSLIIPIECYLREQALRKRHKAICYVEDVQRRTNNILETLMPVQVVEEIRMRPLSAEAQHEYFKATLAQSDLCGFTELASTRLPSEVVEFIGELFGRFDELTDRWDVYKVETVGDAYIAGQAEPPLTEHLSPVSVVRFALAMVEETHRWSRERGESVSCRVGVHTGRCVGGIVGNDMQRYHIFGSLMSELEILESTAPRGGVQISQACRVALEADLECLSHAADPAPAFILTVRDGPQLLTSKGEPHAWEAVGGRTTIVSAPKIVSTSYGRPASLDDIL